MNEYRILAAAVPVPTALWLFYLRFKDRLQPEPLPLVLRTLAFGGLSALLASFTYVAADWAGLEISEKSLTAPWPTPLAAGLAIGAIEETWKFVPVLLLIYPRREFDEEFDGFVYAGAAALGFAAVENWFLLQRMTNTPLFLARAVVSPITHALISAPWGVGLARAKLSGKRWAIALGLVVSSICHGAFDLCLYWPPPIRFGSAFVVLVLWIWLLLKADRQRRTQTS